MSKNLLPGTLKQSFSSNANSLQKKIDPTAQLKWLNSQHGDQGFGIYDDESLDNTDSETKSGHDEGKKTKNKESEDNGETKKQVIIDGELFNYYKTVLMEANEVIIQVSLEFAGKKLTQSAENTLANMRTTGYRPGSNGKLFKTKIVSRQKWINGELKWITQGKNMGNKSYTTKGLELTTKKTTLKKQLGFALKELGGVAVDLADMMLCAEKGNVLDALPTAFIVDIEAKRVNEMINDVSEKQLTKSILEGSASVSKFLSEHYGMDKKYDLIKADSNTANGILNKSITTYSQMLDSIYESTYEENNYSILYRVDSEYLNVRAIMENKSTN